MTSPIFETPTFASQASKADRHRSASKRASRCPKTIDESYTISKGILAGSIPGNDQSTAPLKSAPAGLYILTRSRPPRFLRTRCNQFSEARFVWRFPEPKLTTVCATTKELVSMRASRNNQCLHSTMFAALNFLALRSSYTPRRYCHGRISNHRLIPSPESIKSEPHSSLPASTPMFSPACVLCHISEKSKGRLPSPQRLPVTYGGENEQNQESVASILRALLVIAIALIICDSSSNSTL